MYHDYMLKFDNEEQANAVLFDQVPTEFDEEGNVTASVPQPKYAAIDIIGTIFKPTGEMLQGEDGEYPEMAPIAGWHVNVRHHASAPELDAYNVTPDPTTPYRVWA